MTKPPILQIGAYPDWDVVELEKSFTLLRYYEAKDPDAFVAGHADKIRGIATRGDLGASRALIEALPKLEIISVYGVGYDAVDMAAAREHNVRVTNTPDVLTGDVADLGFAMMMAASRNIIGAQQWVTSGKWASDGMFALQNRVFGKKVGILGLGRIGYQLARRCAAFDMNIAYSDLVEHEHAKGWTYIKDPIALARHSDFLFVTLTGGPGTRHIVNGDVIKAIGSDGMLINVSRASNIDEEALISALSSGALGFAALDVFEGEPKLDPRFLKLENVLLQPHHASGTVETRKAMGKLVRDNLIAHFEQRELITEVL